MGAEGGGGLFSRERRSRMALVVAVQNVLVVACLVVTLYVYWEVHRRENPQAAEDDVHIRLEASPDIANSGMLRFLHVYSKSKMSLLGSRREISLQCSGPYLLYLDVCYKNLTLTNSTARLQLQVQDKEVSSFSLQDSQEACRGLHSTVYLKAKDNISVHLTYGGLKIRNMTMGLSYLLGGSVRSGEGALCDT